MKTYLYGASNLKSTIAFLALFHSGSRFLAPVKKRRFLQFIHNTNWASEASPTVGCSIEISCDICIYYIGA